MGGFDGSGKKCFVVERCLFSGKDKRYEALVLSCSC
jgi:hypothetical protein